MKSSRCLVLVALLCSAAGCSGGAAAHQHQLDEMRREIEAIKLRNERLQERVASLESANAGVVGALPHPDARPNDLDVVRLGPAQDAPNRSTPELDEDDGGPPTVIRVEGNHPPYVQRGNSTSNNVAVEAQATEDYERAVQLIGRKQYEQALNQLAGFLVRFPGHAHAGNAMYWRGECYYAMGNYVRAAEQFEGVVARFPRGNKAPDALLKLGMAQRRMGELDKAANTWDILQRSYPASDAARKIPRQ